jgi:hypothetical protein
MTDINNNSANKMEMPSFMNSGASTSEFYNSETDKPSMMMVLNGAITNQHVALTSKPSLDLNVNDSSCESNEDPVNLDQENDLDFLRNAIDDDEVDDEPSSSFFPSGNVIQNPDDDGYKPEHCVIHINSGKHFNSLFILREQNY